MSDSNSGLKTFFTVITSPIWVPVAAAAGVVAAPFTAVSDSADEKNAAKAVGSYPGNLVGNVVTNPFKAIGEVGKMMSGNDKVTFDFEDVNLFEFVSKRKVVMLSL